MHRPRHAAPRLDALARDMDCKWGACRLPALVTDDLAKRFYSQHRKAPMALREGATRVALYEIGRMVTAWRFLDHEADRLGAKPIHPAVWEVALSDGTVVAIVRDEAKLLMTGSFTKLPLHSPALGALLFGGGREFRRQITSICRRKPSFVANKRSAA